jgi:hypothetical protein
MCLLQCQNFVLMKTVPSVIFLAELSLILGVALLHNFFTQCLLLTETIYSTLTLQKTTNQVFLKSSFLQVHEAKFAHFLNEKSVSLL